jgi:DNA replication protein
VYALNSHDEASFRSGLWVALQEGNINIPYLLLKTYKNLSLNEIEVMLLLHLIAFREREQNEFPTLDELQSRMSVEGNGVAKSLHQLMKSGFLSIDEDIDPSSGVQFEIYNLSPLYIKIAEAAAANHEMSNAWEAKQPAPVKELNSDIPVSRDETSNVFTIFEKEFGRPLSPMECETISCWVDQDKYAEDLIKAALKEAVFAGKLHFRYIDRILLEWGRNRVSSVEEAREFTKKFRGNR